MEQHNRLKLIKATKIEKDSAKIFQWDNSNSDVKWNNSDLYKGINGMSGSGNYFKENSKYSYMSQTHWTNLIDPTTYYIGDSTSKTNSQSFVEERKEHFDNGKISLMYLSDYLYADSSSQNGTRGYTDNWLFIQNGLNGDTSNLGNGATAPTAEAEWTMTRCDYDGDFYHARIVYYDGTVDYDYVGASSSLLSEVNYTNIRWGRNNWRSIYDCKLKINGLGHLFFAFFFVDANHATE